MEAGNLFDHLPSRLPTEIIDTIACGDGVRIERIVSHGHCSPPGFWYDQSESEWVLLLQGEATLRFEHGDRVVQLRAGTHVNIAAHERHRVDRTAEGEPTVWLAVFYRAT
jgi:cupin 2 domain-containing protein